MNARRQRNPSLAKQSGVPTRREREAVLVLRPAVVRGSWELLEVKPPPTPMNRGLQPPPREELLSQQTVSLYQRELISLP